MSKKKAQSKAKKKSKKKTKSKAKPQPKPPEKPPGYVFGRPTRYQQSFCPGLYEHMKEGLSFASYGQIVGVATSTLYQWLEKYPDFSETKKISDTASLYFWETVGRAGVGGKLAGFQNATYIFTMKNKFGWRDRREITGADGGPIRVKDVSDLTDQEIEKELDDLDKMGV